MSLDHLWAGWRSSYVSSFDARRRRRRRRARRPAAPGARGARACSARSWPPTSPTRCGTCSGRASYTVALLNAYPYCPGHVMVLPIRHVRDLDELDAEEAAECLAAVREAVAAVKAAYRPEGMNLGLNLGRAAGAGIPAHLHVHIVPRWIGDTNFMTAVAGCPSASRGPRRQLGEAAGRLDVSGSRLPVWPRHLRSGESCWWKGTRSSSG